MEEKEGYSHATMWKPIVVLTSVYIFFNVERFMTHSVEEEHDQGGEKELIV